MQPNNPINRTQTRWLELILRHFSHQVCAVYQGRQVSKNEMIFSAFVLYFKWLFLFSTLAFLGFTFDYPWLIILSVIGCIVIPVDRVRVSLVKTSSTPPSTKFSWCLIALFIFVPIVFGVWYSFNVELTGNLHRANIVVIWMLFFGVFPLSLYSFWFFNTSSWLKAHNRLTNKQ